MKNLSIVAAMFLVVLTAVATTNAANPKGLFSENQIWLADQFSVNLKDSVDATGKPAPEKIKELKAEIASEHAAWFNNMVRPTGNNIWVNMPQYDKKTGEAKNWAARIETRLVNLEKFAAADSVVRASIYQVGQKFNNDSTLVKLELAAKSCPQLAPAVATAKAEYIKKSEIINITIGANILTEIAETVKTTIENAKKNAPAQK